MANQTSVYISFEVEQTVAGIGQLLRQARLARSLTETQAAQRLGVSRATWCRIEAGDTNIRGGTLLQALIIFQMKPRVLALAEPDALTAALAIKKLPQRGSRSRLASAN
jgi:transcriptional regulator with XRE-family HTH domain